MCDCVHTHACVALTFNLPNVDGRVEALPDVHDDVCPNNMVVPCQCVHLHLAAGHPEGEVLEDRALADRPVKVKFRETEDGW